MRASTSPKCHLRWVTCGAAAANIITDELTKRRPLERLHHPPCSRYEPGVPPYLLLVPPVLPPGTISHCFSGHYLLGFCKPEFPQIFGFHFFFTFCTPLWALLYIALRVFPCELSRFCAYSYEYVG